MRRFIVLHAGLYLQLNGIYEKKSYIVLQSPVSSHNIYNWNLIKTVILLALFTMSLQRVVDWVMNRHLLYHYSGVCFWIVYNYTWPAIWRQVGHYSISVLLQMYCLIQMSPFVDSWLIVILFHKVYVCWLLLLEHYKRFGNECTIAQEL